MKKLFHSLTALEYRWNHGHTKEFGQLVDIDFITTPLGLIKHVECTHHAQVHINELRCEIEVAFEIACVKHIDDNVGCLVYDLFAHIKFFR